MDPASNPFQPGAGAQPPEFIGRSELLEEADVALRRMQNGLGGASAIFLGLRGVGKTVLLDKTVDLAERMDNMRIVRIEVPEPGRAQKKGLMGNGSRRLLNEMGSILYLGDVGAYLQRLWERTSRRGIEIKAGVLSVALGPSDYFQDDLCAVLQACAFQLRESLQKWALSLADHAHIAG